MLEVQKAKATNDILKLNRLIDEFQSSLAQKRAETAHMTQQSDDNTGKLYPIPYSEPDTIIPIILYSGILRRNE